MARDPQHTLRSNRPAAARCLAGITSALLLSACAQTGDLLSKPNAMLADNSDQMDAGQNAPGQTELQRATVYWGQEYAKNPSELTPALNYARNLKALGHKQQALAVLQRASNVHTNDTDLAGEYGRLALDLDQIGVAEKLLEFADSPAKPDWKVISARGTVLAKQGKYKDAIPFYERALALEVNQPSVLSNLAMAHAMGGNPKKAEELLRTAAQNGAASPKIRQNLALVLGLQGRYDEAKSYAATDMTAGDASSNTDLIRRMVKLDAKSAPATVAVAKVPNFKTDVARATPAPAATTAGFTTEVVKAATAVTPRPVNTVPTQLKPTAVDTAAATPAVWKTNVATTAPAVQAANGPNFKGSSQ